MGFGSIGDSMAQGVENVVAESTSIQVDRRQRRVKVDTADVQAAYVGCVKRTSPPG